MGDRTQDWLAQSLAADYAEEQHIFAPILAIPSIEQSEYLNYLADDVSLDISGLAFFDADLLPDVPATTSFVALPRLSLDEPASPHEVLRQISLGMDIFTIPFVGNATDAGIALTFEFPGPLDDTIGMSSSIEPLGLDMWSPTYATSLEPLVQSCTCYACTSHHRAYIVHLLSAKEMLGWTLLQVHNHALMTSFLASVRRSISAGTFESDTQVFARRYDSEIPAGSGKGPRIRGYQFKSEVGKDKAVKGEGKRNGKAWVALGPEDEVEAGGDEGKGVVPDVD